MLQSLDARGIYINYHEARKKYYKPLLHSISVGRLLPHIYTETTVYSLPVRLQGLCLPLCLEDFMN